MALTALATLRRSCSPHDQRAPYSWARRVLLVSGIVKGSGAAFFLGSFVDGAMKKNPGTVDEFWGASALLFGVAAAIVAASDLFVGLVS